MRRIAFAALLTLTGCTLMHRESTPLERQTFIAVYVDLQTALWSAMRTTADTVVLGVVADSVFARNHVSRDQYRATVRWYNEDVVRWKGFFDDVAKALEERSRNAPVTTAGGK